MSWIVLVLVLLTACAAPDGPIAATGTVQATEATQTSTPAPTPTPTPDPTPTPTPTPAPPREVAVDSVVQAGETLWVTISNGNTDRGLIRAGFELAAIAADGSIITVFGQEGLPGAACCTIYHLPPGGRFGFEFRLPPGAPAVSSVELVVLSDWIPWEGVDPAVTTLENVTVTMPRESNTTVTGRATVDQAGPFNIWVGTVVDTPGGQIIVPGVISCVEAGPARAFEITSFGQLPGPPTLVETIAYPTTVAGYGDLGTAPGC